MSKRLDGCLFLCLCFCAWLVFLTCNKRFLYSCLCLFCLSWIFYNISCCFYFCCSYHCIQCRSHFVFFVFNFLLPQCLSMYVHYVCGDIWWENSLIIYLLNISSFPVCKQVNKAAELLLYNSLIIDFSQNGTQIFLWEIIRFK